MSDEKPQAVSEPIQAVMLHTANWNPGASATAASITSDGEVKFCRAVAASSTAEVAVQSEPAPCATTTPDPGITVNDERPPKKHPGK